MLADKICSQQRSPSCGGSGCSRQARCLVVCCCCLGCCCCLDWCCLGCCCCLGCWNGVSHLEKLVLQQLCGCGAQAGVLLEAPGHQVAHGLQGDRGRHACTYIFTCTVRQSTGHHISNTCCSTDPLKRNQQYKLLRELSDARLVWLYGLTRVATLSLPAPPALRPALGPAHSSPLPAGLTLEKCFLPLSSS